MTPKEFLTQWRLDYPENTVFQNGETSSWSGGEYIRVQCPFCKNHPKIGPDKGHHAHVHENWFKCQRCGTKGGLAYLLGRDLPKGEDPSKWETHQVASQRGPKREKKLVDLFGGPAAKSSPGSTIWLGDLPKKHRAWQYLLSEQFSVEEIESLLKIFPIHYCTEGKPFTKNPANTTTNRLIFTIREANQQIGWQARWLPDNWPPSPEDIAKGKKEDRYITSPGFKKSFTLYNIENALNWDTIVVVEGIKKVWKAGLFSVGTLGIGNEIDPPEGLSNQDSSRFWINRLTQASLEGREILFLYDRSGLSNAVLHSETINQRGGNSRIILLEQGKPDDVDAYFRPEIAQLLLKRTGKLPKPLKTLKNPA